MGSRLESIYPCVPVWLQNVGISLAGVAWRHERLGGRFGEYVAGFQERDRWPKDRMQAYVDGRLRRVLRHAYEQVPYYRRAWAAAGVGASDLDEMTAGALSRLPITPRIDLRRAPDEFVARDAAARGGLRRSLTSGSTGTPIAAICTADDHRRFMAAREVRSFGWAGASLRHPRCMIGGRRVVPWAKSGPPYHRVNWAERQVYFSAYHIAPATAPAYVAALNRYRPRVLTGYACSHYLLARMMLAQGLSLDYRPEALVLGSEALTREMRQTLCEAFGARAYEEYGSVENCMLATECERGRLHVSPDFGVVEIVDDAGRPAPAGAPGRILCTGLLNGTQPLVRYELGDLGVWSAKECPCGRGHMPVLEEVVGRLEDVVVGPDGREVVRFHGVFVGLPDVLAGQVVQEALDRFVVRVVAGEGFGPDDEALICRRLAEMLGRVHARVERVADIPRTERGKFRGVISLVGREARRP